MSFSCKDCDRLKPQLIGTAPDRPEYQQPTKYDHYGNFQKFKQSKAEEQYISQRKDELLKCNSNFKDCHRKSFLTKEEEIEQFATQDKAKFRQYNLNSCANDSVKKDEKNNESEDSENDNKSLEKRKSLLALTRTPVQCPITVCNRTIGVTFVLSHFLRDHSEEFGVPCQEIYAGKRSVMVFNPTDLDLRANVCLGLLAYGGDMNETSSRPTERGLCINNAFLPKSYEHLASHLPILIMACRTSWSSLLGSNEKLEGNIPNPNYNTQELLVLWLASVQTVKPIHCTLTVYDKAMTSSRSAIIQIRDLNNAQKPQEFMLKETNFIRLSHGEINILTQQRAECMQMEIMINEY